MTTETTETTAAAAETTAAPKARKARKTSAPGIDLSAIPEGMRAAVLAVMAKSDPTFAVSAILSSLRGIVAEMESAPDTVAALNAASKLGGLYQRANAARATAGLAPRPVGRPRKG